MRTKVKALEWREVFDYHGEGNRTATGDWDAVSPIGTFYIAIYGASDVCRWDLLLNGVTLSDCEGLDEAKAAAQAHFDAAIASVLEDDWQTMETAPKDGTKFDAWARGHRTVDVYWSDVQDWWCTDGDYGPEEPLPLAVSPAPTHWRLPPSPPKAGE